jgi:hypothetical protein
MHHLTHARILRADRNANSTIGEANSMVVRLKRRLCVERNNKYHNNNDRQPFIHVFLLLPLPVLLRESCEIFIYFYFHFINRVSQTQLRFWWVTLCCEEILLCFKKGSWCERQKLLCFVCEQFMWLWSKTTTLVILKGATKELFKFNLQRDPT